MLLKEYKGVKIFVAIQGTFYCDCVNNSHVFEKSTFKSTKLESIEKAIDQYKAADLDGEEYYDINIFQNTIIKIKAVKKMGNRLFFDDGTDTTTHIRREVYPKNIDELPIFSQIQSKLEERNKITKEAIALSIENQRLYKEILLLTRDLKKVRIV